MILLILSKLYMQKTFQEISKSWCETKRPIVKHSRKMMSNNLSFTNFLADLHVKP